MINPLHESEKDIRNFMLEVENLKLELYNTRSDHEKHHRKMLLSILEIVDSLEEKLLSAEKEEASLSEETRKWIAKFRITYKKLMRMLGEENVVPIEVTAGESVNPLWHQAIETTEKEGAAEDTINEVHQRGYLVKGKLLRNSTVTIVKNKK